MARAAVQAAYCGGDGGDRSDVGGRLADAEVQLHELRRLGLPEDRWWRQRADLSWPAVTIDAAIR